MKKLFTFLTALVTFCLTGCLDTQEDITINGDGSGVYVSTINMSGLFEMLEMAAAMDTSANNQLKEMAGKDVDSLIALKSYADTAKNLTAEEKKLFADATMRMVIKQKDKEFKISFNCPFKKSEDVEKIMKLLQDGKGVNPMAKGGENDMMAMGEESMPKADFYDVVYKNGLIERKIDEKKYAAYKKDNEAKEAGQMDMMLDQITFSTAIHLPKAAKSIQGEKIKASDDKKTINLKYSLKDMMSNPKSLVFKVEY